MLSTLFAICPYQQKSVRAGRDPFAAWLDYLQSIFGFGFFYHIVRLLCSGCVIYLEQESLQLPIAVSKTTPTFL